MHKTKNKKLKQKTQALRPLAKNDDTHTRACARLGLSLPLKDDLPDQNSYPGFREPAE